MKTNLFIKVLLHPLINRVSNSLNDAISQTSDDHQYPGQSPLQSRQRLSKQQRPLDCRRTHSDHRQLASSRLPSLSSYLRSHCIWYFETRRSTQLSPTFPGIWLRRPRTGFWAGLSNNMKTGPTRSQPSTRTRYTWPCRTVTDVSHCWWRGFRWTEQMFHHCAFLPSSEATLTPRCSREDQSCWSALKYKHMSPHQLAFTEPRAGVRVMCQDSRRSLQGAVGLAASGARLLLSRISWMCRMNMYGPSSQLRATASKWEDLEFWKIKNVELWRTNINAKCFIIIKYEMHHEYIKKYPSRPVLKLQHLCFLLHFYLMDLFSFLQPENR